MLDALKPRRALDVGDDELCLAVEDAGRQFAATRIRLAKTQEVIAMARMADGSIKQAQATVKVTIGGCGG